MEHQPVTNQHLLDRLEALEEKFDQLMSQMDKMDGAWNFAKLVGSILVGLALVSSAFSKFIDWWMK